MIKIGLSGGTWIEKGPSHKVAGPQCMCIFAEDEETDEEDIYSGDDLKPDVTYTVWPEGLASDSAFRLMLDKNVPKRFDGHGWEPIQGETKTIDRRRTFWQRLDEEDLC